MPAGEPVLGSSSSHRQLLRNDFENSNTGTGHARDSPPTPGQARPAIAATASPSGLRLRDDRRNPSTQECDLCPET